LANLPPWGTFLGGALIKESAAMLGYGWLSYVDFFATALTGAAVLRVAGRVFVGWGPAEPEVPQGAQKIDEEPETAGGHQRIPLVMAVPAVMLSLLGLLLGVFPGLTAAVDAVAGRFTDRPGYVARVLEGAVLSMPAPQPHAVKPGEFALGLSSALVAVLLALATLFRKPLAKKFGAINMTGLQVGIGWLRLLHSGIVADYVTWLTIGLAIFGALSAYLLH
jgi:multicomponent Na+:H+ antiporter subunit D